MMCDDEGKARELGSSLLFHIALCMMPTPLTAINDPAANSPSDIGMAEVNNNHDTTRGQGIDPSYNDARANGQATQDSLEERPSKHRGTINGADEPASSRPSPALTLSSPNTSTKFQVESMSKQSDIDSTGGVHQADTTEPQASSSSASAVQSSLPAEKRKRSKRGAIVKSSSDEALCEDGSECGMVLKYGPNTEETLRRTPSSASQLVTITKSLNFSPCIRTKGCQIDASHTFYELAIH